MGNSPDNITKVENERFESTNVVRSIGMGLRACHNDVLVIYGDLVINDQCIKTLNFNKSSMLAGESLMKTTEVGCIVNKKECVENMMYDLPSKWGQMTFFKGRELKMLKQVCWNPSNHNLFGFEAINNILSMGGNFIACSDAKARAIDIDTSKDLERVREVI